MQAGRIHIGIGGWSYEPWRATFYPAGLAQRRELEYASRQVTAIEINATYYRTQSPASFARWRDETPGDFVFAVKASRYATAHRRLAEAGESVERFIGSGLAELGPKLGPLLWQFPPTRRFDADDVEAFLGLLPDRLGDLALRHVLEVRHESFRCPEFLALARRHRAAAVFTDAPRFPSFADVTADFCYARLMRAQASIETGYPPHELQAWAARIRTWARGEVPADLPRVQADPPASAPVARDVYVFVIDGAKERAPAAAMALLQHLQPSRVTAPG